MILGALKEGGLQVYDLAGNVVQTILPPNRPAIAASDPPSVGPAAEASTGACPDSADGETFGRFNNVDVHYGLSLRDARGGLRKVDVAVVTDRGCDRLRVYAIEPDRAGGPLVDVTSAGVPRVFPKRFVQPSPLLSHDARPHDEDNPLDEQNTAYGLALHRAKGDDGVRAFVTQRSRSVVAELELFDSGDGTVGYRALREYRFPTSFAVRAPGRSAPLVWTPCREEADEDPQLEGLVVDYPRGILYAAQD